MPSVLRYRFSTRAGNEGGRTLCIFKGYASEFPFYGPDLQFVLGGKEEGTPYSSFSLRAAVIREVFSGEKNDLLHFVQPTTRGGRHSWQTFPKGVFSDKVREYDNFMRYATYNLPHWLRSRDFLVHVHGPIEAFSALK